MKNLKTILWAGFVAGTLDIAAAIFTFSIWTKRGSPMQLLQVVASGVYGKEAFNGGWSTAMAGLVFHFIIATSWATLYFMMYPFLPFLKNQKWMSGILYGAMVWCIMNLAVLPLSNAGVPPFTLVGVTRGMGILMVCIGLPISLIVSRHYASTR